MSVYEYLAAGGTCAAFVGLFVWGGSKRAKYMFLPDRVYKSFLKEEGVNLTSTGDPVNYSDLGAQRDQLTKRKRALDRFREWEPSRGQKRASNIFLAPISLYKGNVHFDERKRFREDARRFFTKKYHERLQEVKQSLPESV